MNRLTWGPWIHWSANTTVVFMRRWSGVNHFWSMDIGVTCLVDPIQTCTSLRWRMMTAAMKSITNGLVQLILFQSERFITVGIYFQDSFFGMIRRWILRSPNHENGRDTNSFKLNCCLQWYMAKRRQCWYGFNRVVWKVRVTYNNPNVIRISTPTAVQSILSSLRRSLFLTVRLQPLIPVDGKSLSPSRCYCSHSYRVNFSFWLAVFLPLACLGCYWSLLANRQAFLLARGAYEAAQSR